MARSAAREETLTTRADRDGRYSLRVYPRSHRTESIPYILELGVTSADDRCENDRGMEPNDTRNQAEDLDAPLSLALICRSVCRPYRRLHRFAMRNGEVYDAIPMGRGGTPSCSGRSAVM